MPNDLDLDARIRNLVASAVADAPAAPRIDTAPAIARNRRNPFKWGAVIAALLATLGGGYAVLQPASDSSVDTTKHPTPTTVAAPASSPPIIVTAGNNGVSERVGNETHVITTRPTDIALALDDGRFVVEQQSQLFLMTSDGTRTLVFNPGRDRLELHDFSIVDGRRLVLYSVQVLSTGADGQQDSKETLYAYDLDTEQPSEVAVIGGWETGTSRLHLATTGLIIGTQEGTGGTSFFAKALPGSPAASQPLPTAKEFGIETPYTDCACPTNFTVDADGTNLYWLAPDHNLMKAPLEAPETRTVVRNIPISGPDIDISDLGIVVSSGDVHYAMLFTANGDETLNDTTATVGYNG